jgi:hypothetical protein
MTATLIETRPATLTLVRLRPAPPLEPPYDDEPTATAPIPAPPPGAHRALELPLDWSTPTGGPASTDPATGGEARLAARRYLSVCLEVLGGFRPATHLRPLTNPAVLDAVIAALTGSAPGRSLRPGSLPTLPGSGRILLRRTHLCEPRPGVAEVAAVLARGDQAWAMTLRLERRGDTWLCHHLDVL